MFERVHSLESLTHRITRIADDFQQDLHYAWRQLRRAPAFAALVIATLAIGIGANATMVGVIDRVMFRTPPAIPHARNLVRFVGISRIASGGERAGSNFDYMMYSDFKSAVHGLDGVAGYTPMNGLGFAFNGKTGELNATAVTADFFETLDVRPWAGSFFGSRSGFPTTAASGGPAFAILGFAFWQREFGGDRSVIGRSVQIGKVSYTIIGIAPSGFRGVEATPRDAWIPINVALEIEQPTQTLAARGSAYLQIFGRSATGISRDAISAQASAIALSSQIYPGAFDTNPRVEAAPIVRERGPDAPREVRMTLWLGGVSALVLLIVCANVANLLLGRAFTRQREIAVRLALGAGRARLARQLTTEALLMSAIGGALGLYFAVIGSRFLQQQFAIDVSDEPIVSVRLFLFTAAVAIGTGLVVSLAPMLQSTTPNLGNGLRASSSGTRAGSHSVRTVLLAVQAALCVIMLVGAGLFAGSLRRVQALDLGVDVDHTLQATLRGVNDLPIPSAQAFTLLYEIKNRVARIPGITSVALGEGVFGGGSAINAHPRGKNYDDLVPRGSTEELAFRSALDSGMFRTLGTRSLRGRDFTANDRAGEQLVTILNEPLAQRMFPGRDALAQCVILSVNASRLDGDCVEVIGILKGFNRRSILTRDAMVAYVRWRKHV